MKKVVLLGFVALFAFSTSAMADNEAPPSAPPPAPTEPVQAPDLCSVLGDILPACLDALYYAPPPRPGAGGNGQ